MEEGGGVAAGKGKEGLLEKVRVRIKNLYLRGVKIKF